jgi:hypothetical protein
MPAHSGTEADTRGLVSKRRIFADGRTCGGVPFSREAIHHLLTQPGLHRRDPNIRIRSTGPTSATDPRALWDAVQDALQANANGPGAAEAPATPPTRPTPPRWPACWSTRPATA